MKIAILGTRGIPNYYGGFEQFAEFFSVFLVEKGHDVSVYSSHNHPFQENNFSGVKIIHKYDPEYKIGTVGQYIYDLNCILDTRKRNFDIILQLGYTSSSVWGHLLPKKAIIITNMDGMEWKRTKFSKPVQKVLRFSEKMAVKTSDFLVADSVGIQQYLFEKYRNHSEYIAYGAFVFENSDIQKIKKFEIEAFNYHLLIARLEPENNIEIILEGYVLSQDHRKFLVVGNHETKFGNYLKNKFQNQKNICFVGGIYDLDLLNNLRYFSELYFHGHSVGGTNPSLLEAMASEALIIAHDNVFNKSILQLDGFYFKNATDVKNLVLKTKKNNNLQAVSNNKQKIATEFSWGKINEQYLHFFEKCLLQNKQ
jgi:glycosyltransferase involved in cell wall biosynthesis